MAQRAQRLTASFTFSPRGEGVGGLTSSGLIAKVPPPHPLYHKRQGFGLMRQRGKQSLAAIEAPAQVAVVRRPDAPLDLTPEETDVWQETVDAMPADWFPRETWPLLRQWCRHTLTARRVAQLMDAEVARDEVDIGALDKLQQMQARETAALKALAASMRLSQQASYSARGAGGEKGRRTTVKRPWEV
jgi:hypothetical protein